MTEPFMLLCCSSSNQCVSQHDWFDLCPYDNSKENGNTLVSQHGYWEMVIAMTYIKQGFINHYVVNMV